MELQITDSNGSELLISNMYQLLIATDYHFELLDSNSCSVQNGIAMIYMDFHRAPTVQKKSRIKGNGIPQH